MAGESPDRSKQRKSSAEPTSGSAAPVPEARDPRLAVAREKDSSPAESDTATKILSVRADDTPEEDAALRKAVSTWVRKATPPNTPANEPPSPSAEDPETGDETDSDTPKADAGAEPDAPEASVKPTPKAEEAEAEAETETETEAETEAEAEAEATEDEPEDTDTDPEADATDDEPADADGEDTPQAPPAPDDENVTGGAGGNADADAEGEAEAATTDDEPDDKPDDKPEDAEGEAEAPPVDQPTAVFKTVPPKKPHADQPTTMLKLDSRPCAGKSDSPAEPEDPAKPADAKSTFVALKSDLAAKPPAPPEAKADATTPVPHVGPERTTQQPLPPKPPLDLLAELTNTPPPPETPVRTIVRRVKIWTPLVLLLAIIFAVVQTLRPLPDPTLDLTAKDTYTFAGGKADMPWPADGEAALDVQGIGTFGSSGEQKPVPIASVAKVMTAYIILRDHPLKSGADGPKIKIDKAAEQQSNAGQESTVHVTAGDSITQREALESILIASANNVARLLARWDDGSEKAFVTKMNATAKSLGMTNTTYTDPSGLTNTTVSTAVDQVKLAKVAMTLPAFREVAAMMSYDDYKGVNHSNWNTLVGHDNVVGIKTGTTTSAQGNLVFAAKQQVGGETRTIVGAVLRQPPDPVHHSILVGATNAADKLIRTAQGALEPATVLKKGQVVGYVDDGLGGRTPVVATKDVTAAGWSGLRVKLSFTPGEVPHTAKAGTRVGYLTVGDGSAGAVKVPVALKGDLAEPGFGAKLTRLG